MVSDTTAIYWFTGNEINLLHNSIVKAIDDTKDKDKRNILNRIQSELSVAKPREEITIMPADFLASVMDLPHHAIPIRLSFTEVAVLKTINLPKDIAERLS